MFLSEAPGKLVPIRDSDPLLGPWEHVAFVPDPLPDQMPTMDAPTFLAVADARAALAALDSTARQLPNPTLLRSPTLRREAQSTSALEGTYAPLAEVFTADEDEPATPDLVEILNYVRMANYAFAWMGDGRGLTARFLDDLQGMLMKGTPLADESGCLRARQVVIGQRPGADLASMPIHAARFIPAPPGDVLVHGVRGLVEWVTADHNGTIDPVVAAAMSHYQFETLHPYRDGNGRVGRLLIVLHLLQTGVLSEPTLTVSPWFEARRSDYYDRLLAVSARGDWNTYIRFFARGLQEAAVATREEMIALVSVQEELHERLRASRLRADSAHALVDLAVAQPTFTVRKVESELGLSYGRANKLVSQLVDLEILATLDPEAYKRRFYAPEILQVLARRRTS